jgi:hypothetical protein
MGDAVGKAQSKAITDKVAAKIAAAKKTANDITLAKKEGKNIVSAAKKFGDRHNNFKYNLPPHNWSLPLRPVSLDYDYLRKTNLGADPKVSDPAVDGKHVVFGSGNKKVDAKNHGLRRSRIYFFGQMDNDTTKNNDGTTGTYAQQTAKNLIETAKAGTFKAGSTGIIDRQFGFQFLWNPTDISVSVNRNADITPSAADKSGQMTGNFQGQEQLNFSIIVDRTNDFACAKGLFDSGKGLTDVATYYSAFYPQESHEVTVESRIKDLLTYGTMADLEYLFKTVNGNGAYITDPTTGSFKLVPHTNGLGKLTSDTGYLSTSILAVQFGPDPMANLGYTGWFESLSISHTKFTENMIPLTSVVSVSMTCFTTQPF